MVCQFWWKGICNLITKSLLTKDSEQAHEWKYHEQIILSQSTQKQQKMQGSGNKNGLLIVM